jgi:CubicO group peptidase (beta-lactamase class C family)
MAKCKKCNHDVIKNASECPECGTSYPDKKYWGWEYKSKASIFGVPLLHISFKYRRNGAPVVAKGIISIGQFGIGVFNISQFGIGVFSLSQITIAFYALAQIAFAYSLIAQVGLYVDQGRGMVVRNVSEVFYSPDLGELETIDYTPLPNDDWMVSTPQEQGLDSNLLADLYCNAEQRSKLLSLLVIKNGYLVAEKYFNEGSIDQQALVQSVSKSYISALFGIAYDQGYITDLDQKMVDYLPEFLDQFEDPRKKEITLRQMLQMRSGYPWEETDYKHMELLFEGGDLMPLLVQYPLAKDPGEKFHYSNLTSNVLAAVVAKATEKDLWAFAFDNLLSPIESDSGKWYVNPNGYYYSLFHYTARDMAKFGQLYLNGGQYNGDQVISSSWIDESLKTYSKRISTGGPFWGRAGPYFHDIQYGYQWWSARVGKHKVKYAAGHGGQLIVLLEEYNMVIVTTSDPFWKQHDDEAWRYEKEAINLVGKYIKSLPKL